MSFPSSHSRSLPKIVTDCLIDMKCGALLSTTSDYPWAIEIALTSSSHNVFFSCVNLPHVFVRLSLSLNLSFIEFKLQQHIRNYRVESVNSRRRRATAPTQARTLFIYSESQNTEVSRVREQKIAETFAAADRTVLYWRCSSCRESSTVATRSTHKVDDFFLIEADCWGWRSQREWIAAY